MRYFVSFVVVLGHNTNGAGHVYTLYSQLPDSSIHSRLEVTNAIGLYGHSLTQDQTFKRALFPAELIGPGHLNQEHLRYIAQSGKYYHLHTTTEITKAQHDQLLSGYAQERNEHKLPKRDFKQEKAHWDELEQLEQSANPDALDILKQIEDREYIGINQYKGPAFNFFLNSCMTDAKRRLRDAGIDVSHLSTFGLDIPGLLTHHLHKMTLVYDEGKLFWDSPLTLNLANSQMLALSTQLLNKTNLNMFSTLLDNVSALHQKFSAMNQRLAQKGKQFAPLTQTEQELALIKSHYSDVGKYPNRIDAALVEVFTQSLVGAIQQCHADMDKFNIDNALIRFMRTVTDLCYNCVMKLYAMIQKQEYTFQHNPYDFIIHAKNSMENLVSRYQATDQVPQHT